MASPPQRPAGAPAVTRDGLPAAGSYRSRESGENFPVALRLLPRDYREDLHAVYAYARTVDEIGDSYVGDRTARLADLRDEVRTIWSGRRPDDPVLRQLARTVWARGLAPDPFEHLIEANLQDQRVTRYATYADLRDYCRLSADPVGRIVLAVFDQATPETIARSDQVCTALQLLEHWQDVAEDYRAGRVYLPREDLDTYGVDETDLGKPVADPRLRELIRFEITRAAALLDSGARIVGLLHGWARVSVAGFVAGGQATVAALRRTDGDVLSCRSRPSRAGTVARVAGLLATAGNGGRSR